MMGPDIDDEEKKGVIPRMVDVIFDAVAEADAEIGAPDSANLCPVDLR